MVFVLQTITGGNFLVTQQQKEKICSYIENGSPKAFFIGENMIVIHQISGIFTQESFERITKQKLSAKGLRMCKRCATIVPRMDKCPCVELPEKYPDILVVAKQENPELAKQLNTISSGKSFPQIS